MAKKTGPHRKVRAAAWTDDGSLVLLVEEDKTSSCVTLRGDRVVAQLPAVARAKRLVALASGAVLTMDINGKSRRALGDTKKNASIDKFGMYDLVACDGVAYAAGAFRRLMRYDESANAWTDTGLEESTRALVDGNANVNHKVYAIVSGARGPIVGVTVKDGEGGLFSSVLMEWDGSRWTERARVEARLKGLTRDPLEDVVYAVGQDTVCSIDRAGNVRTVATPPDTFFWDCKWIEKSSGPRGHLFASTLFGVMEIQPDGKLDTLLPRDGKDEVPHNHSLFARGVRAAFVRGDKVRVFEDGAWKPIALE